MVSSIQVIQENVRQYEREAGDCDSSKFSMISYEPSSVSKWGYNSIDDLNYSVCWFAFHRNRETAFGPWFPNLGDTSWEELRLVAIGNFWKSTVTERINPVTIHLAIWVLNKLLSSKRKPHMTREWFAATVAVGLRIALKFEERPDALWGIGRIWDLLPMFDDWSLDKHTGDEFLLHVESEALRTLNDCIDVPLALQFFDKYMGVGGWPPDMVKQYTNLGHYLLGLSTFATGNVLANVPPSELGAAAAILSVKILNGDPKNPSFEFFPERLSSFCQLSMKQLSSPIRGLSSLLRNKPDQAKVLQSIYREWAVHEWQ